jgi:exopolyphosphatase/guanosine-5'-triphosphate,3'-diphosphate pyrophosphatase
MAEHDVARCDVVGTSAMRDAEGGEAFRERAGALLGVEPRVISGDEEARLTFEGALVGLPAAGGGEMLVFDVGGGSTELVLGDRGGIRAAKSLDVGGVRLTERHLRSDPPTAPQLDAVRADVRAALSGLTGDLAAVSGSLSERGADLVGVAGTVTSLAAIAAAVDPYDASRIHGARLLREELAELAVRLGSMTIEARRQVKGLSPKRADVIVAGAIVCDEVAAWSGATGVIASDRGVRWGLALRLAREPSGAQPAAPAR